MLEEIALINNYQHTKEGEMLVHVTLIKQQHPRSNKPEHSIHQFSHPQPAACITARVSQPVLDTQQAGQSRQRFHAARRASSLRHAPTSRLQQDPRIPRMQLLHPHGHRPRDPLHLLRAHEEGALQPQYRLVPLLVDLGTDEEQSVRVSRPRVSRCVAASHRDLGRRFVHHLEVIRHYRAGLVV